MHALRQESLIIHRVRQKFPSSVALQAQNLGFFTGFPSSDAKFPSFSIALPPLHQQSLFFFTGFPSSDAMQHVLIFPLFWP